MKRRPKSLLALLAFCVMGLVFGLREIRSTQAGTESGGKVSASDRVVAAHARAMIDEGKQTFRFDTFGDEHFWGDVANLEMHGQGIFFDPRLDDAAQFPIAAANGFGHVKSDPDLVTPKLPALQFYQLALEAPRPLKGSFDATAAARGESIFNGKARCASCHVPPIFTEPGWNLHAAADIGIDDFQANRSPDRRYRTAPLRGLWTHGKGGFYHDGRFATLNLVVDHYDSFFALGLGAQEKSDLVEYLESL
jgi:hypothetical protein